MRGDLSEGKQARKFPRHSLQPGLAFWGQVDERYMQKQLDHSGRRRDRFRLTLTMAVGSKTITAAARAEEPNLTPRESPVTTPDFMLLHS
jgi:hypothetical protein